MNKPSEKIEQERRLVYGRINQAIEERLQIQTIKDNLNPFTGISPYYPQGMIYDYHFVPPSNLRSSFKRFEQIDLPISPHGRFYIKFAPVHPSDDKQILV